MRPSWLSVAVAVVLAAGCTADDSGDDGGSSAFGPRGTPDPTPSAAPTPESSPTPASSPAPTPAATPEPSPGVTPPMDDPTPSPEPSPSPPLPDVDPVYEHGIRFGGWTLEPGEEDTRCVEIRLNNAGTLQVGAIRTELAPGSHHMIIYRSDATQEQRDPYPCLPFLETITGTTVPLAITQIREETVALPKGVAFRFEPNQMIRIEAHFVNSSDRDLEAQGVVEFGVLPREAVRHNADFMFYGNPWITIPPVSELTLGPTFLSVPAGTKVFGVTGHTHHFGTDFRIEKAPSKNAPGESIYAYEDWDWEEPPVERFDPPLEFAEGEGLRFTCEFFNTSFDEVGFGESANDEMCFLWAYYYPSRGYRLCVNIAETEVCCPGNLLCDVVADLVAP